MSWREIWSSKQSSVDFEKLSSLEILQELLILNGFDSKSGTFRLSDYLDFIQRIVNRAVLQDCKSVFEVGCGAGAFLYALQLDKQLGGGGFAF